MKYFYTCHYTNINTSSLLPLEISEEWFKFKLFESNISNQLRNCSYNLDSESISLIMEFYFLFETPFSGCRLSKVTFILFKDQKLFILCILEVIFFYFQIFPKFRKTINKTAKFTANEIFVKLTLVSHNFKSKNARYLSFLPNINNNII